MFIYLFIYLWLHWVFIVVRGLLIAVASLVAEPGSTYGGFSSCGTWAQ